MSEPPDIVSLFLAALAWLFASKELAEMVSPYMAIVLAALAGAGVSLSHSGGQKMTMWAAIWYVGVRLLLAVTITVWLADMLNSFMPAMKPRITIIPLALLVGMVRDWETVRRFIFRVLRREAQDKFQSRHDE